jgi:ABC-type lipoprotein release transport system permease subunit
MNPLSPVTYHWRHKRSTLVLIALICLATTGVYVMVGVIDSIPMRAHVSYLTQVSRVYPVAGDSLEPGVLTQIQTHPGTARVIPDNGLSISPPTLIGLDSLRLMGVFQQDAIYLMAHCGVRLKQGRMFEPRTNEIVLSEEVARALELELGDEIARSISDDYYGSVQAPLVLVGILEGDPAASNRGPQVRVGQRHGPSVRVGFASYEYLEGHELYAPRGTNLLVIAQEGHKGELDEFLETEIASSRTETETYAKVSRLVATARQGLYVILSLVNSLVAVVVALVVGVINRIALTQRLSELGLLNAMGHHKTRIIGRLTLETAAAAAIGWGAGLGLAWLVLAWLKGSLYYARGMELDLTNLAPLWFVVPIPAVVVALAAWSAARVFARFDAVAIIERGKLGTEGQEHERRTKRSRTLQKTTRSSASPLSSWTFYLRHRRRGVLLVVCMALMTLGVAFPVFLTSAVVDAMRPSYQHLRYVGEVSPATGTNIDPAVTAQIKSHPAVARVVPAMSVGLYVVVPPGSGTTIQIYGVSETDLPGLLDRFGTHLVAGRLPRTRSNEIVLSQAAARNRGLRVGDRIGRPVQGNDMIDDLWIEDDIPIEMVVVGLLSREDLWTGLASLEYLQSHELAASRPLHQIVLPAEGRKEEMDRWLEEYLASAQTGVHTYDTSRREEQQITRTVFGLFAAVESMIAFVAAIALAALNHISFAQRREEFGILHAVGHSRPWLILRTVREAGGVVVTGWLVGAAICLVGLIGAQVVVYAPRGLRLNLLNLLPWLFTLPIPLVVTGVGAGTVSRTLSRLDPVSVIERR